MRKIAALALPVGAGLLLIPLMRFLPDWVENTIAAALIAFFGMGCLGGYLYRRKMQREGKWPVEGKPTA
jgi:hypothetical protein